MSTSGKLRRERLKHRGGAPFGCDADSDSGTLSPYDPGVFHDTVMLSIIRPLFGQDCAECWRLVARHLRMTLDGKGKRQ